MQDAVVLKDESVRATCVRLTSPNVPAELITDFDGNVGYKNFTEEYRFHTRNLGHSWVRRIVFTAGPSVPHKPFSPRGTGSATWQQDAPTTLDDDVNSAVVELLFGQCRGQDTTVRVRDLLYGKPCGPGVTILENQKEYNVQGKAGQTVVKWPRQNSFTKTKRAARVKCKVRDTGAYGPELFELSDPHVYVFTVFVAGYEVLGLPVPRPANARRGTTGSEDSDMVDLSNLSVGGSKSAGKRIKVEPGTEGTIPVIERPPKDVSRGQEQQALTLLENNRANSELDELFEVSITNTLRFYFYKKFV